MSDSATPIDPRERVALDYPAAEIFIRVTTEFERKYRIAPCQKEPWTVEWLDGSVQPGDVFYDIGANIGAFSLIAAVGRGARVVACEPSHANYNRLCENIELNSCGAAIVAFPLPLAETNGMTALLYRDMTVGQSRHVLKTGWHFGKGAAEGRVEQPMSTITLDTARTLFKWPDPAHIKLDVDGVELRVLAGATATLGLPSLRSLMIEVRVDLWPKVKKVVTDAGLRVSRTVDRGDAPMYALFERGPA
ncbi:MAG: FkbM family methyltransferase [Vicinamibacterales bacterium]